MPREPLTILLKVRRFALNQARSSLGHHLEDEARAVRALGEAEAEIALDMQALTYVAKEGSEPGMFLTWLDVARTRKARLGTDLERARHGSSLVQATVAAARGDYEATEAAISRKKVESNERLVRREQVALDEAACYVGQLAADQRS